MSDNGSESLGSDDDASVYDVERILAQEYRGGNVLYLVKWLNYDDRECTWESAASFDSPESVAEWQRQLANHDTLDEEEVERIQARMDAFQKTQEPLDVEKILAESSDDKGALYLVKWLNFNEDRCTWEPEESFLTPVALDEWERQFAAGDVLDERGVSRVQARMNTFQPPHKQWKPTGRLRLPQRSLQKSTRESPSRSSQKVAQKPRHSPIATTEQHDPVIKPKKGIAQPLRSGQKRGIVSSSPERLQSSQARSSILTKSNERSGPRMLPETSRMLPSTSRKERSTAQVPTRSPPSTHLAPSNVSKSAKLETASSTLKGARTDQQKSKFAGKASATLSRPVQSSLPSSHKAQGQTSVKNTSGISASRPHPTESKAGKRFNNLSHQNNYMKKARWERAPDPSKMDLMSPEEFGRSTVLPARTENRRHSRDSPLFVPEDDDTLRPSIEDEAYPISAPRGLNANTFNSGPDPPILNQDMEISSTSNGPASESRPRISSDESAIATTPAALDSEQTYIPPPDTTFISHEIPVSAPKTHPGGQKLAGKSLSRISTISGLSQNPPPVLSTALKDDLSQPVVITTEKPDTFRRNSLIDQIPPTESHVPRRRDSTEHQPPNDAAGVHQLPAILPRKGHQILTANNGRTYRNGEIIVNLRFGDHIVGDVKFVYLPRWTSSKMLRLKEPHISLQVYFLQSLVMTTEEFTVLSRNLERRQHRVAAIEGYEDTLQGTQSLAEYLETHNLGAVWECPGPGESFILVLYSSKAPGWQHLEHPPLPISTSALHLAVLNKVPGYYLTSTPTGSTPSLPREQHAGQGRPCADLWRPQLQQATSVPTIDGDFSPTTLPTPVTATSLRRDSVRQTQTPKSPGPASQRNSIPSGDPMEWSPSKPTTESHIAFSANFDEMVNGLDRAKKGPRVFISFAKSHPVEAKAVKAWLNQHLSGRSIYSDDARDDWHDFREETSDKSGVILFHEQYPCYCDMPSLHKCLRSGSLFCYNISFRQTKQDNEERSNVFTRIFQRGTVLCITEDTFTNHPVEALSALKWFENGSTKKELNWKLVLVPDFVSWILLRVKTTDSETETRYMKMLEILRKLQMRWSEATADTGRQHEDPERFIKRSLLAEDDQFVMSPTGIPVYRDWVDADMRPDAISERDQKLLEYFAGWSALNASRYRQFTVADANHTNKTDRHSCHINFREPIAFMSDERKKKQSETRR